MTEPVALSPNRVGVFATIISLLLTIIGAGLLATAGYNNHSLQSFGGLLFWVGIMGTLFSFLLIKLYFWTFRPTPKQENLESQPFFVRSESEPQGIGGWLFFPILGMILAPLWGIVGIVRTFDVLVNLNKFGSLFQSLVILETAGIVFLNVIMPVYLLTKLNAKSVKFPRHYIFWMVSFFVFLALDTLASYLMFKDQIDAGKFVLFDNEMIRSWGSAIAGLLIWVPYMLRSRRVRNTFVEQG